MKMGIYFLYPQSQSIPGECENAYMWEEKIFWNRTAIEKRSKYPWSMVAHTVTTKVSLAEKRVKIEFLKLDGSIIVDIDNGGWFHLTDIVGRNDILYMLVWHCGINAFMLMVVTLWNVARAYYESSLQN